MQQLVLTYFALGLSLLFFSSLDKNLEDSQFIQSYNSISSTPAIDICDTIYLSDIDWVDPPINGYGPIEKDKSVGWSGANDGPALSINGQTYEKGLGVHATSEIIYDINGAYHTFSAVVGMDDFNNCTLGASVFEVYTDGNLVYTSPLKLANQNGTSFEIDVTDVLQLKLVVTRGPNNDFSCDRADWADAKLMSCTAAEPLQVTITTTQGDCDNPAGSTTATVVGGTPPYSYLWSNGLGTATITDLDPGVYVVYVHDASTTDFDYQNSFSAIIEAASGVGSPCDDGNACTTGDVYQSDCNCAGTLVDSDNDGVCDAEDTCPGFDDTLDSDGDGTPDGCEESTIPCDITYLSDIDWVDPPINGYGPIEKDRSVGWSGANDGPALSINGQTYEKGLGVHATSEIIYDINGAYNTFSAIVGMDDFNNCTLGASVFEVYTDGNLAYTSPLKLANQDGTSFEIDVTDVLQLKLVVTRGPNNDFSCDRADWADVKLMTCDPNCIPNTPCDDGNACTTGDVYQSDCNCAGTLVDSDNDGVCDAEDVCPGFDDNLIGTSCDDGNACTTGDVYQSDCNCAGTLVDSDNDGVCDAEDICPGFDDALDSDGDGTPDGCEESTIPCDVTYLSDIDWVDPPINGYGPIEKDKSVGWSGANDGPALSINGQTYEKGLGVHASSEIIYDINGAYHTFSAVVGMDDFNNCTLGASVFEVYTDGNLVYTSPLKLANQNGTSFEIDVTDVLQLKLVVTRGPNNDFSCDRADWADAKLMSCTAAEPLQVTITTTQGDCDNPAGSTTATVVGGTPPYSYLWSNGLGTATITDLDPGVYVVYVHDASTTDFDYQNSFSAIIEAASGVGSPCDDGNACTTGDVYQSDCNCAGTLVDSDNDGVCDAEDICPGFDDTLDSDGDGTPDGCEESTIPCDVTYLSDIDWVDPPINGYGPIEKDKSVGWSGANDGPGLSINGQTYEKGLGVHATSEIIYDINGAYHTFSAVVGMDDFNNCTLGASVFEVYTDGNLVYTSPLKLANQNGTSFEIDVTDVLQLKLVVTRGPNNDFSCDRADWADAKLMSCTAAEPLQVTITTTQGDCDNPAGSTTATVVGGTPPYSYLWSNGLGTATITDLDPGVYVVYVHDASTTDFDYQNSFSAIIEAASGVGSPCDDGNPNTSGEQIRADCSCGLENAITTSSIINASSDDAEEQSSGIVSLTSSNLELINDNTDSQVIGLRFTDLNIPQGATITHAVIQFTVAETTQVNPSNLNIQGQASDDAATFSDTNEDITNRPVTVEAVSWFPPVWSNLGEAGVNQRTPNISAVIQEIVDRGGYTFASAIAIIINGAGTRVANAFDGSTGDAPILIVEYVLPLVYDCPTQEANIGDPCDDGNALTTNDVYDEQCNCAGTIATSDCNIYETNENTLEQLLDQGDIAFIGFDNDIGGESDRIILTNLVPIRSGTKFTIANAVYCESTEAWYSRDAQDGNISAQTITYAGEGGLAAGSIICLDIPAQGAGEALLIQNFTINGITSDAFSVSNGGHALDPDINLLSDQANGLFIMQGRWSFKPEEASFNGRLIGGLRIGDPNIPSGGLCGIDVNLPDDLQCTETPKFPVTGSYYGYFDCSQFGTTFNRFSYLSSGNNGDNWTQQAGTAGLDLPSTACEPVCTLTCEELYWSDPPGTIRVSCTDDNYFDIIQGWADRDGDGKYVNTCAGDLEISHTYKPEQVRFECAPGSLEVKFTIKNECGQMQFATGYVILEAIDIAPTFSPAPASTVVGCEGWEDEFQEWINTYGGAQVDDACGEVTISYDPDRLKFLGCGGSTEVVFYATNICGVVVAADPVTFTVEDDLPPQINDQNVYDPPLNANETDFKDQLENWRKIEHGGATATDNCTKTASLKWTLTEADLSGYCNPQPITFTVDDECGNTDQITVNLTIVDDEAPEIGTEAQILPLSTTADPADFDQAILDWLGLNGYAKATDKYTTDPNDLDWSYDYDFSLDQTACSTTEVTFTVTDRCGNSATTIGFIVVSDDIDPTISTTEIAPIVLACEGIDQFVFEQALEDWIVNVGSGLVSDNLSADLNWEYSYRGEVAPKCADNFTVIFSVDDRCSNLIEIPVQVIVEDTEAPIITLGESNFTWDQCDPAAFDLYQEWFLSGGNSSVTDNCQENPIWLEPEVNRLTTEGTYPELYSIIFRASDDCDNISTFAATLTVAGGAATVSNPGSILRVPCTCNETASEDAVNAWLANDAGIRIEYCDIQDFTVEHSAVKYDRIASCDTDAPFQTITFQFFHEGEMIKEVDQQIEVIDLNCNLSTSGFGGDLNLICGEGNQAAIDTWLSTYAGISIDASCGEVNWVVDPVDYGKITNCETQAITFQWTDDCGHTDSRTWNINFSLCPEDPQVSLYYDLVSGNLIAQTYVCDGPFYEWFKDGVSLGTYTPNVGDPAEYHPSEPGRYKVEVANCFDCEPFSKEIDVCVVMEDLELYSGCNEDIIRPRVVEWLNNTAGIASGQCDGANITVSHPNVFELMQDGLILAGGPNYTVTFILQHDGVDVATFRRDIIFTSPACSVTYAPDNLQFSCGTFNTTSEAETWLINYRDDLVTGSCGVITWDPLDDSIAEAILNCQNQTATFSGKDECSTFSINRNIVITCDPVTDLIVEEGGQLCVDVASVCPGGNSTYSWIYLNQTASTRCITPSNSSSAAYAVTVTCGSCTYTASKIYQPTCPNNPEVDLTHNTNAGTLTASTSVCQYPTYQWYLNDVLLSQHNGSTTIPLNGSGEYKVVVTGNCLDCPDFSETFPWIEPEPCDNPSITIISSSTNLVANINGTCENASYQWYRTIRGTDTKLNGEIYAETDYPDGLEVGATYTVKVECEACDPDPKSHIWCGGSFNSTQNWGDDGDDPDTYYAEFVLEEPSCDGGWINDTWIVESPGTLVDQFIITDLGNGTTRFIAAIELTQINTYVNVSLTVECGGSCSYTKEVNGEFFRPGIAHRIINTPTIQSTSIAENDGVHLFPNPTKSEINLSFNSVLDQDIGITIFDASGRRIQQSQQTAFRGENLYQFDTSRFSSGIYLVRIQSGDQVFNKKFLVVGN